MTAGADPRAAPAVLPPMPSGVAWLREAPAPGAVPAVTLEGWGAAHGVEAGLTLRGTPEAPFDVGLGTAAPVGAVTARWRALRDSRPGFEGWVVGHQVHGAEVAWHGPVRGWLILDGIDGHATDQPGVMLAVTVADCVPAYVLDRRTGALALLHAGWRGTAHGILARALRLLAGRAGTRPDDVALHLGVAIGGSAYEVGAEVVEGCGLAADGAGPWRLDLRAVLARQAEALGVGAVTVSPWCTVADHDRFFSHRASRGADGRMVAFLGRPGLPADIDPRLGCR